MYLYICFICCIFVQPQTRYLKHKPARPKRRIHHYREAIEKKDRTKIKRRNGSLFYFPNPTILINTSLTRNVSFFTSGHFFNTTLLIPDTWTHLVFNINGSSGRWYLNGVSDSSPGTITTFPTFNLFGDGNLTNLYTGKLDNLLFYNRALTTLEITELYNGGAGLPIPAGSKSNFFQLF